MALSSRTAPTATVSALASSILSIVARPTAAVRALSVAASRATVYARDLPLPSIFAAAPSRIGGRARPTLGIEFGTLWNPANSPGTVAWWNADDLANGAVSIWVDRVGGIGLLQASGVRQPTKAASSFNSAHAGVTFAGVSGANATFLKATTGLGRIPVGTDPRELWGAIDQEDTLLSQPARTAFGYASAVVAGGMDMKYEVPPTSANPCFVVGDTLVTELQDTSVNPFVGPHVVGGRFDTGAIYARIDGSDTNPTGIAITFNTDPNISFTMGGSPNNATIHNWQGVIRHAIVGYYTAADRLRMEGWMAWDCGLQSMLPSSHPYKGAPPLAVSDATTATSARSTTLERAAAGSVPRFQAAGASRATATSRPAQRPIISASSKTEIAANGAVSGAANANAKASSVLVARAAASRPVPRAFALAWSAVSVRANDLGRKIQHIIGHPRIGARKVQPNLKGEVDL